MRRPIWCWPALPGRRGGRHQPLSVRFVQALRQQDLFKAPGVAETLDWATALRELDAKTLTPQVVGDSLGALLKYQDDIGRMQGETLTKTLDTALAKSK